MQRYPSDAYVDVIIFDAYQKEKMITDSSNEYVQKVDKYLGLLKEIVAEKNKISTFVITSLNR